MQFLSKEKTVVKAEAVNLSYVNGVGESDPVFKIVHSNEWYIAAYVPFDLVSGWTQNSTKTIYIEQGKNDAFVPIEVRVERVERVSEDSDERFVLLKSTRNILDFIYARGIRFMVDTGVQEGYKIAKTSIAEKTLLKIPEECVFESAGRSTVIKRTLTGSGVSDENIQIIITRDVNAEEGFVYVLLDYNKISPGIMLMVKDKPLETRVVSDIENVRGVYVLNTGTAIFTKIDIGENSIYDGEYVILDPALNRNIKLHDRIVVDVRNLTEKQVVY